MKSIFLFLLPFSLFAQEKVDGNRFLELGLQNWMEETPAIHESIYFPWIEQVELRTESDEFKLRRQEYTLRLSPTTPGIRKAQQQLLRHIHNKGDFDLQKAYCKLRSDIHEDWLDLYLIEQNQTTLVDLGLNISDRETVYNKLLNSGDVDFQKLINLKTDKSDIAMAAFVLDNETEGIQRTYLLENVDLDFKNMLTIEEVMKEVSTYSLLPSKTDNSEMVYDREMINRELALERAERRQIFDFAQLKYQGPHDDEISERVSIGLGLRLNRDGGSKLKIRELEVKKNQLEKEERAEQSELQGTVDGLIEEIRLEYNSYQYFLNLAKEEEVELNHLANKIKTLEGFNPLLLLNIGERKINSQLKRLKYEENIYKIYLDFLAESGKACEGDRSLLVR